MPANGDSSAPRRGEIWFADLGNLEPSKGAEIQKQRPVLVIGKNIVNECRRTVLVIPLATSGGTAKANPPITVEVHSVDRKGVAVIDQLRALDKQRLLRFVDVVFPVDLKSVEEALRQVLELG